MENKIYLDHYRLALDQLGLPFAIRRSASEGTFRGEDIRSHETVAVQIIPLGQARPAAREQLKHSARLANKIAHRHVLAPKDFGFDGDRFVYVTEYFDGNAADDWVRQHGPLPVSAVLRIAAQIVSALAAASFHELTHPALNPSNIMLVPGQTPEGDWPLIKVLNFVGPPPKFTRAQAAAAGVKDPVNFASPEQLEGSAVDFASEIYSLGCTLWFLLAGVPPLAGAATVANAKNVPAPVRNLLATMLAVLPNERPRDPVILQGEIQECLAHLERRDGPATKFGMAPPAAVAPLEHARQKSRVLPTLALAALLVALAVLAGLFLPDYLRDLRKPQIVGVPSAPSESSPAPAAASLPNETSPAPAPAATEPQVLVSTASVADEKSDAASSVNPPAEEAPSPAEIAANDAAPTPEPLAAETPAVAADDTPVLAETTELAPPAEGPTAEATPPPPGSTSEDLVDSSAPSSSETALAMTTPTPAATPSPSPEPTVALAATAPTPTATTERSAVVAKPTARPRKNQLAGNSAPALNRAEVRPQFLGFAPDGSAIFGVPPAERAPSENDRTARRRPRPRATPAENLPVLPALPPDE